MTLLSGATLAVGCVASDFKTGQVEIWDWRARKLLHTLPGFGSRVPRTALLPDGRLVVWDSEGGLWTGWAPRWADSAALIGRWGGGTSSLNALMAARGESGEAAIVAVDPHSIMLWRQLGSRSGDRRGCSSGSGASGSGASGSSDSSSGVVDVDASGSGSGGRSDGKWVSVVLSKGHSFGSRYAAVGIMGVSVVASGPQTNGVVVIT